MKTDIMVHVEPVGPRKGQICTNIILHSNDSIEPDRKIIDIVHEVRDIGIKRINILGMNVLKDSDTQKLVHSLFNLIDDAQIKIFTDGNISFDYKFLGNNKDDRLSICINVFSPIEKYVKLIHSANLCYMDKKDSIVFVIRSRDDLKEIRDFIINNDIESQLFVYIYDISDIKVYEVVQFFSNENLLSYDISIQY